MRLRPSNFPTIRLSQFADLISKSTHLFSKVLEAKELASIIKEFNVSASEYWHSHFTFDKPSTKRKKEMGINTVNLLVINTVIPVLFLYGRMRTDQQVIDRSIKWLEQLAPESNTILSNWKKLGVYAKNAFESQALIWLKNAYCKNKRCLRCSVGNEILSKEKV
jgi:hypothetical protein